MVRVAGLEPTASCPPDKRATSCATPGYVITFYHTIYKIATIIYKFCEKNFIGNFG